MPVDPNVALNPSTWQLDPQLSSISFLFKFPNQYLTPQGHFDGWVWQQKKLGSSQRHNMSVMMAAPQFIQSSCDEVFKQAHANIGPVPIQGLTEVNSWNNTIMSPRSMAMVV